MAVSKNLFTSNSQTWETPQWLFDKLDEVFKFDLDVCALDDSAKCKKYYTPEDDALIQEWKGVCWMNPPYDRNLQPKFLEKAKEETKKKAKQVVCLIPARTDTKSWQDIIFKNGVAFCFVKGRLKFGDGEGAAPFPSAIVVFGDNLTKEQKTTLESLGKTFTVEV